MRTIKAAMIIQTWMVSPKTVKLAYTGEPRPKARGPDRIERELHPEVEPVTIRDHGGGCRQFRLERCDLTSGQSVEDPGHYNELAEWYQK
jgi:hypothetical protein